MSENHGDQDVLDQALEIQRSLLSAIAELSTLKVSYGLVDGQAFSVKLLREVEKSLTGWIRATLKHAGVELPRSWGLNLDLRSMETVDDGDGRLTVTLDFAKIFGTAEKS